MPTCDRAAAPCLPPQEELGYLKSLWDMVAAVMHTCADWNATLWGKINVDSLIEVGCVLQGCRLGDGCRGWES